MFSCAYCSIYPLTTVKVPAEMIWNAVVTSTLSQIQLPGIESLGYSGKLSEVVTSSNILKQTQPIPRHWVPWDGVEKCWKQSLLPMYSNGPGDLYFWASLGQLHNSVCQLCLLKNWIDSTVFWYLYPWSCFLYRQVKVAHPCLLIAVELILKIKWVIGEEICNQSTQIVPMLLA